MENLKPRVHVGRRLCPLRHVPPASGCGNVNHSSSVRRVHTSYALPQLQQPGLSAGFACWFTQLFVCAFVPFMSLLGGNKSISESALLGQVTAG